jgi:hypothetical protein
MTRGPFSGKEAPIMADRLSRRRIAILLLLGAGVACLVAAPAMAADDAPASGASATDQPTYDLRYKLATGDVLRYEVEHRANIRSTIDDSTQVAQTKTNSVKLWKVVDVLPGGEIEVMHVVDHVKMVNELPDRAPTEYDSQRDETPPPGYEDAARAVGVPLSVVRMTPHGEVLHREIKHQQAALDQEGPIVVRLPDKPVAIGATWDEPYDVTVQLQSGGTKSIQTRRHFKLADVQHGIATIDVAYQVLSPIDAHVESQLVQRLMTGTVRLDVDAGRIVSQQLEVDKRVLGFAGPTSSMHYVMRLDEKLAEDRETSRQGDGESRR